MTSVHLTTAHTEAAERDASISWLRVKMFEGTAGLDPWDAAVMIVEVASPDRAWRLDLIGTVIGEHPHVRPDRSTCTRVRAILEADVRQELGLDEPGAPTLETPLASRRTVPAFHDASAQILEFDRSRRAGRGWR